MTKVGGTGPLFPTPATTPAKKPASSPQKAGGTILDKVKPLTSKIEPIKDKVDVVNDGIQTFDFVKGDVTLGNAQSSVKILKGVADQASKRTSGKKQELLDKASKTLGKGGTLLKGAGKINTGITTAQDLGANVKEMVSDPSLENASNIAENVKDGAELIQDTSKAAIGKTVKAARAGKGPVKTVAKTALKTLRSPVGKAGLKIAAKGLGRAIPGANAVILASDIYDAGNAIHDAVKDPSLKNVTKATLATARATASAVGTAVPVLAPATAVIATGLELLENVDPEKAIEAVSNTTKAAVKKVEQAAVAVKQTAVKAKKAVVRKTQAVVATGRAAVKTVGKKVTRAKAAVVRTVGRTVTRTKAKVRTVKRAVKKKARAVVNTVGRSINQGKAKARAASRAVGRFFGF